jgi:hypothetical protein
VATYYYLPTIFPPTLGLQDAISLDRLACNPDAKRLRKEYVDADKIIYKSVVKMTDMLSYGVRIA